MTPWLRLFKWNRSRPESFYSSWLEAPVLQVDFNLRSQSVFILMRKLFQDIAQINEGIFTARCHKNHERLITSTESAAPEGFPGVIWNTWRPRDLMGFCQCRDDRTDVLKGHFTQNENPDTIYSPKHSVNPAGGLGRSHMTPALTLWPHRCADVNFLSLRTLLTFTVPPATGRSWTDLSSDWLWIYRVF